MKKYTGFGVLIAGLTLSAGAAGAQDAQLTPVEQQTVTEACEVGLPIVPVESDFGYETGEYALPLHQSDGEVHSALIIQESELQDIPQCRAIVEKHIAKRQEERDNNVS